MRISVNKEKKYTNPIKCQNVIVQVIFLTDMKYHPIISNMLYVRTVKTCRPFFTFLIKRDNNILLLTGCFFSVNLR